KDVNQIEGEIINFYLRGSMRLRLLTSDGKRRTFTLNDNAHIFEGKNDIQMAPVNRRFWSKSPWKKTIIILGGPIFNISAAMIIFMLIGVFIGTPSESLTIGKVHTNSMSQRAGMQQGDTITTVNNVTVQSKSEYDKVLVTVKDNTPYNIVVNRNGNQIKLDVPHVKHTEGTSPNLGFETIRSYGVMEGLKFGLMTTTTLVFSIILGLKAMFTLDFANLTLGGPLSIFQQNTQVAATSPYESVLLFIAMMSLNLGILNLFPIPLLDGGRLVTVLIEKLTHRKISRKAEAMMTLFGIVILLIFIIVLTFSDIQKIFNR
ncbi:MAG: site-2 protease family protein, partial [Culicoidibacterales bacterium]